MATLFGLRLFPATRAVAPDPDSLLATFSTMVASGELDSSDAEERFQEVLARAETNASRQSEP
jgi:hypothetical protein